MKKAILLCGALLALTSSVASAQGGLNFAWDGCPLTAGGVSSTTFLCDEFDEYLAYGAFVAPAGLDGPVGSRLSGQDIVIDIETASSSLPAYWDFTEGGCRPSSALAMGFARPSGCTIQRNYWVLGAGGIAAYRVSTTPGAPTPAPNRARIIGAAGLADANTNTIPVNQNVFSFSLTMTGEGTSTCGGCNTPVALVLNQITLGLQNGDQARVTAPGTNNCISANGATPGMCGATSARNKTWGQVKALYR